MRGYTVRHPEAADLDAALKWAEKATVACRGAVEVRPFQAEPES